MDTITEGARQTPVRAQADVVVAGGGPAGIEAIAATLNEESDTLVDMVEPYLLKTGFLARTARGRLVRPPAYQHLGISVPGNRKEAGPTLFESAAP